MIRKLALSLGTGVLALLTAIGPGRADEGLWPFSDIPHARIQKAYGVSLSNAWAQHVQRSSVRFDSGASGSFISQDGLVMTNHHVGLDALQNLSTAGRDYVKDGFYARTRAEEARCPGMELDVLQSSETVTSQVLAGVTPSMTAPQALLARRAAIAAIQEKSLKATGLRSDVVVLFGGARYDLYRYKKYTDVRLVIAPEDETAFFGGDPDNFEFPRYDLDICFFRVYENGKPVHVQDYLTWSKAGASEGDVVFVSGHPGHTSRLETLSQFRMARDFDLPRALNSLRRREVLLLSWGARSPENAREVREDLFGTQNSRKLLLGQLQGLQDPQVMAAKAAKEQALRARVAADPKAQAALGDAWSQMDGAVAAERELITRDKFSGVDFSSDLFGTAGLLVVMAQEDQKPDGQRLPGFNASDRESLELGLYSPAPIYPGKERLMLADALGRMEEEMGADDPFVQQELAGRSPTERAADLVNGTLLADPAARRKLAAGGLAALTASTDPMVKLALLIVPKRRILQKQFEEQVQSVQHEAFVKIARAEALGGDTYPDATDTLRLSYGPIKGYVQEGKPIPAMTRMGDIYAYAAHDNIAPFHLPPRWTEARMKINPATSLNFVCTADTVGGNSGSPVVNRNAELVGIIFDGNIQFLIADRQYTDSQARTIAVDSRAIIEALRHIYDDGALADEIVNGHL